MRFELTTFTLATVTPCFLVHLGAQYSLFCLTGRPADDESFLAVRSRKLIPGKAETSMASRLPRGAAPVCRIEQIGEEINFGAVLAKMGG